MNILLQFQMHFNLVLLFLSLLYVVLRFFRIIKKMLRLRSAEKYHKHFSYFFLFNFFFSFIKICNQYFYVDGFSISNGMYLFKLAFNDTISLCSAAWCALRYTQHYVYTLTTNIFQQWRSVQYFFLFFYTFLFRFLLCMFREALAEID